MGIFTSGGTPEQVHDLSGNVWEWTASFYDKDKDRYVLRGGSWGFDSPGIFRCADRRYGRPLERGFDVGFRCART